MDILSFLSCYFPSFGHVQVLSEFWQGPSTLDLINTHRESSTYPKRNYWNVYEANLYSPFHQSHISLVCAKVNVTHWIPAASPCSGVYYQHYEIPNQSNWDISPVNKSNNVFFLLEFLIFLIYVQHDSTSEMGKSSHRKGTGYIKVPSSSMA